MSIVYPVSRLLSQPKVFYAIANYLGGPEPELIRTSFYDLLEIEFDNSSPEDCEFEPEEVCFDVEDDGSVFLIQFDTGIACRLEAVKGEMRSSISNEREFAATSAIYQKLVSAIEESFPEFKDDVVLCSPPTPGNEYLSTSSKDAFEGSFHLKSNPEKQFAFNVFIVDEDTDEMKASVKPI